MPTSITSKSVLDASVVVTTDVAATVDSAAIVVFNHCVLRVDNAITHFCMLCSS